MNMKINKYIYITAMIILLLGVSFVISASFGVEELRLTGYITIMLSSLLFIIAFLLDFRKTMILSETAGDQYTLMTKEKVIKIAQQRGIEIKKNAKKDYYVFLLREQDKEDKDE